MRCVAVRCFLLFCVVVAVREYCDTTVLFGAPPQHASMPQGGGVAAAPGNTGTAVDRNGSITDSRRGKPPIGTATGMGETQAHPILATLTTPINIGCSSAPRSRDRVSVFLHLVVPPVLSLSIRLSRSTRRSEVEACFRNRPYLFPALRIDQLELPCSHMPTNWTASSCSLFGKKVRIAMQKRERCYCWCCCCGLGVHA